VPSDFQPRPWPGIGNDPEKKTSEAVGELPIRYFGRRCLFDWTSLVDWSMVQGAAKAWAGDGPPGPAT
jgi:hypothetical protein